MILKELIQDINVTSISGDTSIDIKSVAYHSENVVKDCLFVAITGLRLDGHDFVDGAIKRGARALILEKPIRKVENVCHVVVRDSRVALAKLSSRFYHHPSQDVKLIGITGTNGKTTTAYLLESIFKNAGIKVGMISTINYRYMKNTLKAGHTTPESLELQKILRDMVDSGVSHVVIEVSSHALDLRRVDGCSFDIGVFTNLSRDHLDYHQDMASYYRSKERLFTDLLQHKKGPWAVINDDDPKGEILKNMANVNVLTFGINVKGDIWAGGFSPSPKGISAKIHTPYGPFMVESALYGKINLYNILAATGVCVCFGIPLDIVKGGIESLSYVPGRLQKVSSNHDIRVFVDYAHTDDALKKVLLSIKEVGQGRIICVFGCGGDRDPGKRPLMGQISGKLSDFTIITSDNPRTEDPYKIIGEIEKGIKQIQVDKYAVIPDRGEAIQYAIDLARPGDTVLIAGKGHETYQILRDETRPFDDLMVAKEVLDSRKVRSRNGK